MIINNIYKISRKLKYFYYLYWNRLKFRLKGVNFGANLLVFNQMYLDLKQGSILNIGNNFTFTSGDCFNPLSRNIKGSIIVNAKASINIGNNVGISSACLWAHKCITIGNNVKIGADCIIFDSDAHSLCYIHRRNWNVDKSFKNDKPIIIENDVLIGTRCIILKGVTIGARSIIGSGSVVTKTIPADCIAAGNPCKVIKYVNK